MARALRALVVLGLVAAAVYGAAGYGRAAALLALVGCLLALLLVRFWLPRAAHRSFERGEFRRARLLYGVLRRLSLDRATRAALDVSLAACALAMDDTDGALARLDRLDPAALGEAARAAWLNNRAYALARGGGDAAGALAACEQAMALRSDVAGFRHTRGVALLALGRLDDAIRELDAVWHALAADEAPPLLEAERCFDLGVAWSRKGERDYARDYFERAQRAAPGSRWAARAAAQLATAPPRGQLQLASLF